MIINRPIEILLIEDNPSDVVLTKEAFEESGLECNIHVAKDGVEGLDFLYKREKYNDVVTPDIVLLDINMPKKGGKEVLSDIKKNPNISSIPVIMLTTSKAINDIKDCYALHANSYILKPVSFFEFLKVVEQIKNYWIDNNKLPSLVNH
ncbi:MAG: response regulator [Chitinophagales bacterium]